MGDKESRGCRQIGKVRSFLGNIIILKLLTRKGLIFDKIFKKTRELTSGSHLVGLNMRKIARAIDVI